MNFRCAVVLGRLEVVADAREKLEALRAIVNHAVAGRWDDTRPPNERELRATLVLALEVDEASAKVRAGGPVEDPDDLELAHWAGVLPTGLQASGPAIPAADLLATTAVPGYVSAWAALPDHD
jgi:hypothetical protein